MSTISASTTTTTAYKVTADTTGTLVLQTGATPTTALTISSAQVVTLAQPLPLASGGTGSTTGLRQIQSISASVAANAMTISASALTLDFRSTTATSGTITTVTGTPANLTVPSNQSFGIATTTVSNRYAVLCFNNAGTLALALSPLQGGVQLDETNFLSPTSTPTNTLTTIFSTITASSIAYRVIGFVDVIYVNGTGYSNAPTLVQGVGGEALSAMSSLGYSQTWQLVTGSRAIGTTYYNTTGRPIFVSIQFATSSSATATLTIAGVAALANSANAYYNGLFGVVPPSATYVLTGASSLTAWAELR